MHSKAMILSALVAFAEARFGQEQVPIPAISAVTSGGKPGQAATLAGSAISTLLAAANPCAKLQKADEIIATLGTGADSVAAAKGLVAAEQNFNPFSVKIPSICSDPTLPTTEILRGITPLIDPAVGGSATANSLSKQSLTTAFDATGLSVADVLAAHGFSNFTTKDLAGTVGTPGKATVLPTESSTDTGAVSAAATSEAADSTASASNTTPTLDCGSAPVAGNGTAAAGGKKKKHHGHKGSGKKGSKSASAATTPAAAATSLPELDCGDDVETSITSSAAAAVSTPELDCGDDSAATSAVASPAASTTSSAAPVSTSASSSSSSSSSSSVSGSGSVQKSTIAGLDFGLCVPTIKFEGGLGGRPATEFTFQLIDKLAGQGQEEALNPNIITNRVCDQLTNVCKANAAAKTACQAAKAKIAALGTRNKSTADAWNAALGFAGTVTNPDGGPANPLTPATGAA